jgi:hypothetical protein
MEQSIIITLSTGKKVSVYPVPPYTVELALAKHKKPEPPRRKVNPASAIPGVTDQMTLVDEEDPDYKDQLNQWALARMKVYNDTRLLYGLRDEQVPENWPDEVTKEAWEFLGIEVDLSSKFARRLAWLKHGVLVSGVDTEMVFAAMGSFEEMNKEEAQALLDSFRPQGKRDTNK